jgi:hypothetical protein
VAQFIAVPRSSAAWAAVQDVEHVTAVTGPQVDLELFPQVCRGVLDAAR